MPISFGPVDFDDATVIRQLQRDLRDDWFPDPRRYDDVFVGEYIKDTVEANFDSNHGRYVPTKRNILNVPKANFTLRYGLETSISDRVVYHALTSHLVPFYDPLIPWCVFSHRAAQSGEKRYLFNRAVKSWQDFIGVVRTATAEGPILLSTDLTNYFENIDIDKLRISMIELLPEIKASAGEKGGIRSHIDLLFSCMNDWCYLPGKGLPQNRDASSFLANIYMLPVDRAMLKRGYKYFRYMDDIKIACGDEFEARRALKELGLELRKLGLAINSGKTEIAPTADADRIKRCLDVGGDELREIDAIWQTRSLPRIRRTLPRLRELSLQVLGKGEYGSREFRFCVRRLQALASCPEFLAPPEYFEPVTGEMLKILELFPAATDQVALYLLSVEMTQAQLECVALFLQDVKKSPYTWQNYRLWMLLAYKIYRSPSLMELAKNMVMAGADNPGRCGATLYIGAVGGKDDRIVVAKNFKNVESFFGQRIALIAVQELHFRPHIEEYIKPFLRPDLNNVFRGLRQKKLYVAPPEPISIVSVFDTERDYE